MQDKRITIRIPFEIWKALRELQTEGKISSIQQAAVTGMDRLIESLKKGEEENQKEAAKQLGLTYHQFRGLYRQYKGELQ